MGGCAGKCFRTQNPTPQNTWGRVRLSGFLRFSSCLPSGQARALFEQGDHRHPERLRQLAKLNICYLPLAVLDPTDDVS